MVQMLPMAGRKNLVDESALEMFNFKLGSLGCETVINLDDFIIIYNLCKKYFMGNETFKRDLICFGSLVIYEFAKNILKGKYY